MKTKNKKIFALLCFPALVMSMILPLCSFLTTDVSGDFYIYEPVVRTDIVYNYDNRSTTTGVTTKYIGSISNYNRLLVPVNEDPSVDNISFVASEYNILGNPSMKIKYLSFNKGSSISPSSPFRLTLGMECTGGNENRELYFTGNLVHSGVIDVDTFSSAYIIFPNDEDLDKVPIRVYGSADYIYLSNSFDGVEIGTYEFDFTYIIEDGSLPRFYYSYFISRLRDEISYLGVDMLYITNIDVNYECATVPDNKFSSIIFSDTIDIQSNNADMLANFNYEYYYKTGEIAGYIDGYDKGIQAGSVAFESLGDFLSASVGSFFEFEIWDGFSLGTVMSIFVGAMLLIAFLKIFAGG